MKHVSFAQQTTCTPTTLPLQLGQLANNHPIDGCACVGAPKGAEDSQIFEPFDRLQAFLGLSTIHVTPTCLQHP
jgi:hypothetical protein